MKAGGLISNLFFVINTRGRLYGTSITLHFKITRYKVMPYLNVLFFLQLCLW